MRAGALRVGSIRGIDIRIHRSWVLIALLVAWSFSNRYATLGDHRLPAAITMGVVASLLFFVSVLVHELAHSLEARHRGVEVGGITLFLFGGATETRFDVERPFDEFALTAVGPFSSFVLAATFALVATYGRAAGWGVVAEVAGTLGWINLGLGVFNLLPGAPLDGGRILRSAVWKLTGDRRRAIRVAARAGQVIGYLIAGVGLLQLFAVPGAFLSGIWWVVIGWFLANAAGSEIVQHELQDKLGGATLADLVSADPLPRVSADIDVAGAADELRHRPESVLSLVRDGEEVALVGVEDVASVPAGSRAGHAALAVGRRLGDIPCLPDDTPLLDAVRTASSEDLVAVTGPDGEVIGVVSSDQLRRVLERSVRMDAPLRSARRRPQDHLPAPDRRRDRRAGHRGHVPGEDDR
ncbi:MAG: site-2 protease family protein [Actinobacteria bacterium]|nr:site-2 protease family protein [Actinomycetota bacterium]